MDISPDDRATIKTVISEQLQAFQQDDSDRAFSFATPSIQQQFQNPQRFLQMVRTAYPSVYRPRSVIFETLAIADGQWVQSVLLMDSAGDVGRALYLMNRDPRHGWRIDGCLLVDVDETLSTDDEDLDDDEFVDID
jgi:hypothetical protein